MTSIPLMLLRAARENPSGPFLRWVDPACPEQVPSPICFFAFEDMVRRCITSLRSIGIQAGERVLFLAENSPFYQALMIACMSLKVEPVCLYENLGNLDFMDVSCRVLPKAAFISHKYHWEKLSRYLAEFGTCRAVFTSGEGLGLTGRILEIPFTRVLETQAVSREEFEDLAGRVDAEDPFVLIFTIGTTGGQKGVRIPQRAAISALHAGQESTLVTERDVGLHVLPFGHIAGQLPFYLALQAHGSLILCSRREDLIRGFELGPNYVLLVPLIYDRMVKEVKKHLQGLPRAVSRWIHQGIEAAIREQSGKKLGFREKVLKALARRLVGGRLRKRLGGMIRVLGAGGAPSDPELVAFYRGLGLNYLNLYGMSETCGVIAFNQVSDPKIRIGSVGRPWRELTVRIDEDGEILVKGQTLMTGYLEKEDEAGVFTEDGFLRTGDLGSLDEEGYLFVQGRKKNILVLTTGKKVSPEPLELRIREILLVTDAVLIGDNRPFVACGLFVSREFLADWDKKSNREKLAERFLAEIHQGLSEFSRYEIPKKLFLIEGAPYEYPKIITPTLKVNRRSFAAAFAREIEEIYGGKADSEFSRGKGVPLAASSGR